MGSLLRTAEGFGLSHVYFTGYTPYPPLPLSEDRLPHLAAKLGRQISKTALGAENTVRWSHDMDVMRLLSELQRSGYRVAALEQAPRSIALPEYAPAAKVALLIGREVEGIDPALLTKVDDIIEIPMYGQKESFNVAQATAVALYHLRSFPEK